jgi:protein SCO1/2
LRFKLGFYNANPVTDADLKQHTGMVRIGHDGRDRWSMIPAQATTAQIVTSVMGYL